MAVATLVRKWTLAEMHRLPEDGNKYELVRGALFVTPPPSNEHENIAARLSAILVPYVEAQRLGHVYHPRTVLRHSGSEVEPDLLVRREHPNPAGSDTDWNSAPVPVLVVEIASPYTRRRDRKEKKQLYLESGIAEYWIVDGEAREISVIRAGHPDQTLADRLTWSPRGAAASLTFHVATIF